MQSLSTAPSPGLSPQVQMGDTRRQIEMMPCMQVLSTAPSPRHFPQVQMGDTRRQIEMMYAEGHKQKASLLAQQQKALKV